MSTCSIASCGKPRYWRGLCQMHRWRLVHYGDVHYKRPRRMCSVTGCDRWHKAYDLCSLHRDRRRRGLPMDYQRATLPPQRYRTVMRHEHPLADVRGRVAVHRASLYDAVGGSRLPCFWCGSALEWRRDLFVDHLNHDRHDNRSANLVPSCNGCNAGRTSSNPRVRTPMYSAVGS